MGEGDDGGFGLGDAGFGDGQGFGGGWGDSTSPGSMGDFGSEGIGSAGDPGGFGSDSFGLSDAFGLNPGFSLGDINFDMPNVFDTTSFGIPSESIGFSPSFVDSNMSLNNSFGVPDEEGFGKFAKGLFGYLSNPVAKATLSMLDKTGIFGPTMNVAGLAAKGAKGDNAAVGKGFGGMLGGMVGSSLGPLGSMVGGALGGLAGQTLGGVTANQGMVGMSGMQGQDNTGGSMLGDVAGGLAGLYMGNRAKGQYNQALNSLNDIYSPNGVYAQQLRQQLERRDAAAGRRSQYGPREAQLMATLADRQAQTMSSSGYANLMQQRGNTQNQGLQTLLALMSKNNLGQKVWDGVGGAMRGGGLQALFNNGYSNNWDLPANAGPQLDEYVPDDLFSSPGSLQDPGLFNDMPNYFDVGP